MAEPNCATLTTLDAARAAAIDVSGWGRRFTLWQPSNLALWIYLPIVSLGVLIDILIVLDPTIVVSVVAFTTAGGLMWWWIERTDRYTDLPTTLMVAAFLWGAAVPQVVAAEANAVAEGLYAKALNPGLAATWSTASAAPVIEELTKGCGLLLLMLLAPKVIRTAFDGFVLGAMIGLGFEIVENISYAANNGDIALTRLVVGAGAHIVFSAIFCAGLVYLVGRPAQPRQVGRGLGLMGTAVLLHALWNAHSSIGGSDVMTWLALGATVLLTVLAAIVFVRVYRMTVSREHELMRTVMAPEVARGVLTLAEVDAVAGDRKARKAYRQALAAPRPRRTAHRILDAAYDLAGALSVTGGADSDSVQHARYEIGRLISTVTTTVIPRTAAPTPTVVIAAATVESAVPATVAPGVQRYGGLLRRGAARTIDFAIFLVIASVVLTVVNSSGEGLLANVLIVVALFAYSTAFEAVRGWTPGKRILRLRVGGPGSATKPTLRQAALRNVFVLSIVAPTVAGYALLVILVIAIGMTIQRSPTREGLHDSWAGGTVVLRR
ncbi:PrsW family glutamic-type intramembrane protease [Mycobacterium syngnathidarum]